MSYLPCRKGRHPHHFLTAVTTAPVNALASYFWAEPFGPKCLALRIVRVSIMEPIHDRKGVAETVDLHYLSSTPLPFFCQTATLLYTLISPCSR